MALARQRERLYHEASGEAETASDAFLQFALDRMQSVCEAAANVSDESISRITTAVATVNKALEPLESEERARVLESASALYGLGSYAARPEVRAHLPPSTRSDQGGASRDAPVTQDGTKRLSLVEFLDEKAPVTNTQRIVSFAFYREHFEGHAKFARGDLAPYFAAAKLKKPGNYDRDFAAAVKEGWIHEEDEKSYLTQKGESAVKQGFGGKAKPRGAGAPSKKRTGKTATPP